MVYSKENLCLAVRRITQLNRGRNTPGLDIFLIKEDRYRLILIIRNHINIPEWKPYLAYHTYIPKKNGKLRPLRIPTIIDRVIQAIVKNSLEPEWECKSDIGSYGFRPSRSPWDALEKIHITLTSNINQFPKKFYVSKEVSIIFIAAIL
jgi:RNA-directed DNA polymerase